MGYVSTEYVQTLTLNLQEAKDAARIQQAIINQGLPGNNGALVTALGGVLLGLLSLVFKLPTVVSFSSGVTGTALGLIPSEKAALTNMATQGLIGFQNVVSLMAGTNYDLVEFDIPKIRFTHNDSSKNWEMATGNIRVRRMHSKSGGWILA
ncbi:hypothetical protein J7E73_11140 [Paenibacillus albidus]|uniref:hypothetical protein n=1 Tax=Paenibacillus albidus TaxID=2041023 RepID=UPI001BEA7984|nr:hypothetical protein [Paenibacillus albidus]MBT2289679.1 hypothetical protein [Paenibacillus albidus]